MEILGVGASEFVFILILALIILGPKDMQKAGKAIGKWLRKFITSDSWKVMRQTSNELRHLPNRLMREANEELGDVREIGQELKETANLFSDRDPRKPVSTTRFQQAPVVIGSPADKTEPPSVPDKKASESDPKVDA
jgi:Sec-independent protein translocase protein TatA